MTFVRRNIWKLGTANDPWEPITLGYARAVRAMQTLPLSDPRSWRYQAAIHGLAGTPPPAGAPWNECQHATWYFLPWHRMLPLPVRAHRALVRRGDRRPGRLGVALLELRSRGRELAAAGVPRPDPSRRHGQPAVRRPAQRGTARAASTPAAPCPASVTSSTHAMASSTFATPTIGTPVGFGGPRTGFAHFGPAPGLLENQPHNIMHVVIGGNGGLMTDPDTAALDPSSGSTTPTSIDCGRPGSHLRTPIPPPSRGPPARSGCATSWARRCACE